MKPDPDWIIESDQRPWGGYVVLVDEPDHKVKRIEVLPGKRLSLQRGEYFGEDDYGRTLLERIHKDGILRDQDDNFVHVFIYV